MQKYQYTLSHCCFLFGILALLTLWGFFLFPSFPNTISSSLVVVGCVYLFTSVIIPSPTSAILNSQVSRVIPTLFTGYGIAFFALIIFRVDYSRPILLIGSGLSCIWLISFYIWHESKLKSTLYMVGNIHINDKRFEDKLLIKKYTPNIGLRELGNGILIDVLTPITKQEEQIIIDCSVAQIPIYHINQLQERLEQKVSSIHLSDRTIQALHPESNYFRIKSTLDILLALMGIVILLPIMATIYLMIKIQQGGSAIYKQKRIGQHNQTFTLYKFRTMVPVVSEGSAKFASTEQHRISRFGRFLRKTRLDEIPQFFNVLKGEMSIIGPRPEQPCFANQFAEDIPFYNFRHIVKPGITGWAQVTQGYTHSFESTIEKLAYDFYYLKHLSWQLDFEIYLKTIRVIVTGKGAI